MVSWPEYVERGPVDRQSDWGRGEENRIACLEFSFLFYITSIKKTCFLLKLNKYLSYIYFLNQILYLYQFLLYYASESVYDF